MADVNANIGVHIDTSAALAELKNLQRQLATFHASIAKGSAASAMAQKNLQTNLLNSINATGQFTAQMGLVRTSTESFTHALEKNKLGMKEYFRYAGGATRTFGRLFKQEFDTIEQVAQERVKRMQTQFIKMGRDANGAMKAMSITPTALNMKDLGTQTQIAAQKQALFNQLVRQGSTNLLNFGKNTQWAGRQLMVGFTVPLAYLGTVAAKTFMDLEKQAIRFKRVYGDMFTTTEDTAKALKEIELLAQSFTKYGVAVVDTMQMAADAAAMGKTGAELTAQVAQATRLAVLGSVEQQQALETTISLTNAFGVAAEDLTSKIDFLNSVENQTVVSIEDLTIAIPKAGPVIQQLGGDVEDLAFFLTAMKEGGINASEGANALKSGLASLINPSKKASTFLNDLGVNINAIVEGNKGNIRETVIDFSEALDTLDPLNRARAIEQLFGKFQFSRLSTLFQNVTKDGTQASRVLELAGASIEELAILSERELKAVEDSVGTNFKAAVEDLKLTLAPIGKEFLKAVTPIVKVVGDILEKFNGLSEGTKKFIVVATALVGLIGPTLLMTFGLLANGAANIIKLFLALRMGFMKLGGNSKILAEQTNYMTTEQLEAATVATSLNQAHTRLTQSFNIEAVAVKALRQAYVEATVAATKFAMANPGMMVPGPRGVKTGKNNLGQKPRGFSSGTTGLPGPIGAGDIIPILAAPGEAIIPSAVAQDPKFKPIISAMVNGTLQGFVDGTDNVQPFANSPEFKSKIDLSGPSAQVLDINPSQTNDLIAGRPRTTETNEEFAARSAALLAKINERKAARDAQLLPSPQETKPNTVFAHAVDRRRRFGAKVPTNISDLGFPSADAFSAIGFDLSPETNSGLINSTVPIEKYLSELESPGSTKTMNARLIDLGFTPDEAHRVTREIKANLIKSLSSTPANTNIGDQDIYSRMGNLKTGILGGLIRKDRSGNTGTGVKMLYADTTFSPVGASSVSMNSSASIDSVIEQVKKTKTSQAAIRALENLRDVDPNYELSVKTDANGNIVAYERPEVSKKTGKISNTKVLGVLNGNKFKTGRVSRGGGRKLSLSKSAMQQATDIEKTIAEENIKRAKSIATRNAALEEVAARTKNSPVANQDPEQYVKQLTKSSGFSFSPAPGIAGLYEKPDGTKVFVKPVMDYASAIAEQRGTEIVRKAHKGLIAPEQTVKTMIDPTDETGQRKLIVLESPYDERFDERKMRRTFTQDEYITQLLASSLRGDKDLKAGNLGGNVVADVGNAGVFTKASGLRDYATDMPSVYEMMQTNVREVPGEFAGKSPFWFSNTTADVARSMTADEFARRMDAEVARTTTDLESTIKGFNLIDPPISDQSPQANSMRAEKAAYEYMLKRLRDAKGQNWKEIHRLHTSIAVKPDELLQDDVTGELEKPKTKPKPSGVKSTGSSKDTRTTKKPKDKSVVQRPRNYKMRGMADAPEARTSQGIRIIDTEKQFRAEQNSLRRQLQKLEKIKIVETKKEIKLQRRQSEIRAQVNKMQEKAGLQIQRQEDIKMQNETDKRMARQQNRIMKLQGVGMAAGMASGGAYMTGNTQAGNALMAISVLATMGPMLASPVMAAVVGLTALGGSILLLRRAFDKSQDDTMKMTESLGAGNKAIEDLAVFAGKVSASEIMDKRRSSMLSPYAIQTGKTTFGQSFVNSESGKSMLSNVGQSIKDGGSLAAQNQVLSQMTTAVASGALNANQARSIVANIASELGDYSFGINVNAKLVEILGPNGENLAKDPLEVRIKIMKDSRKNLEKQSNILGNVSSRSLTRAGEMLSVGRTAGLGAMAGVVGGGAIGNVPGAIVGGALGLAGGAATGYLQRKNNQEKLGNASGATVAMQKIAIEQSQQMQDSLTLEYEKRIAIAKAAGNIVKADEEQLAYEKARAALLIQNSKLITNIQNTYKNSSSAVREALQTGIDKQITNKYKGTVNADIAPLASDLIKDSALSKEAQFTIKMQLASGQMDPMQIVNFMETFGNDKTALSKVMKIVTDFGGSFAGQAMSVASLFQDKNGDPLKEQQTTFFANIEGKTSAEAEKYLSLFSEIGKLDNVFDVGVLLSFYNKNPNEAKKLQGIVDYINEKQGKITLDVLTKNKVLGAKEMEVLRSDQEYFDSLPPVQQKLYLRSLTTLVNLKGTKEAIAAWKEEKGNKGKSDLEFFTEKLFPITKADPKDNTIPGGKGGKTSGSEKKRDTTYDDILTSLKRTKDATIDTTKGASELMRVLGGKKELKFFNGIDQQLSKIGANSGFIDFVGGAEKAIQNKLIKINKNGVVSLTEFGKAAKKAYDAKQLGSFSAKSAETIKQLQGQRKGFVALKAAGASSADALKMVEDADFAVSLSKAKTSAQVKKLIKDFQDEEKAIKKTLRANDPQAFLKTQMDVIDQKLDLDERIARRKYERDTKAAEDQIDINNKVIKASERELEVSEVFGDRRVEIINNEISALQRKISLQIESQQDTLDAESRQLSEDNAIISNTVDAINKKYDEQEEALSKIYEINQDIAEQEKERLGLADAITQGDISAAATAAQEIRARNAARSGELAQEMLGKARESEISGVKGTLTGKTADAIAARQYQIERLSFALSTSRLGIEKDIAIEQEKLYQIEVKRKDIYDLIRKTQDDNYRQNLIIEKAQDALDKELAVVKVQRDRMTDLQLGIDKATQEGVEFTAELSAAYKVIDKVSGLWNGLTSKNLKVSIEQIEETIKNPGSGGFVGTTPISAAQIAANAKVGATIADLEKSASPWLFGGNSGTPVAEPKTTTASEPAVPRRADGAPGAYRGSVAGLAMGGMVPKYFVSGGFNRGTDTIPAMLTPGEFVVRKNAVDKFGVNNLNNINDGTAPGNSVYNYSVNIDVAGTDASSSDIARSVIGQIKYIDSQRIRGQR
jgi:TP901 family phage tail tape measure protein